MTCKDVLMKFGTGKSDMSLVGEIVCMIANDALEHNLASQTSARRVVRFDTDEYVPRVTFLDTSWPYFESEQVRYFEFNIYSSLLVVKEDEIGSKRCIREHDSFETILLT